MGPGGRVFLCSLLEGVSPLVWLSDGGRTGVVVGMAVVVVVVVVVAGGVVVLVLDSGNGLPSVSQCASRWDNIGSGSDNGFESWLPWS